MQLSVKNANFLPRILFLTHEAARNSNCHKRWNTDITDVPTTTHWQQLTTRNLS